MQFFSCFTKDARHETPTLWFIFAADLDRARELAKRELMEDKGAIAVDICEADGRLLWTEAAQVHPA